MEVLELGDEVQSVPEDALDFGMALPVRQLDWTPDGQILTVASQVQELPCYPSVLLLCTLHAHCTCITAVHHCRAAIMNSGHA